MRSSTLPFSLRCADAAPSPLPVRPQNASAFFGNASLDFASCANHPYAEVRIVRSVASAPFTFVVIAAGWLSCIFYGLGQERLWRAGFA